MQLLFLKYYKNINIKVLDLSGTDQNIESDSPINLKMSLTMKEINWRKSTVLSN